MNEKYISEGVEDNLPAQHGAKSTASRNVFLPRGILMLLIVLLASVSSLVCSRTFAEERIMLNAEIDRTKQMVQETGIAKKSVIQNRPPNVYNIFKWQILSGISLLVALSLLVFFLFINIRKRKAIEYKLQDHQIELEAEIVERQKEEGRYRTFVQNSIEAVWAYDLEPPLPMDLPVEEQLNLLYERAYISEANDALALTLGYEKGEELLGMRLDDFQPRTEPENVAYVKNVVREKYNVTDFETTAFGSAGEVRILLSNILGIFEDGKLRRIWGTSRDITEQKVAEKALHLAELKYRSVVENANEAIFVAQDYKIAFFNTRAVELLGYSEDELYSTRFVTFIYPEDRETVMREYEKRISGDQRFSSYVTRILRKNGEMRWVNVNSAQIIWEDRPASLGLLTDITDQKQAQEVMCISEARLKEAERISHLGNWDWDIVNNNLNWSDEIFRIFGIDPARFEATYEAFLHSAHPEDREYVMKSVDKALNEHKPYNINHRIILPDGTVRIVHEQAVVSFDDEGRPVRMFGTVQDVTAFEQTLSELKNKEQELIASQKDLRKLAGRLITAQEKELSRLARELHDDLTQQLAVAAIQAGSIEQDFKDLPGPVLQKVSSIKDQLIKISKEVHNISRDLHPSILDDVGLERAVRSECKNFSSRTGIAVIFNPKNVSDKISKDKALTVYRIIQEGLSNIAKHADSKNAYVLLEGSDGNLICSVRDSGVGFDPSIVGAQAALGLGSIRERVRLVNGKSSITSSPGKGTTIEVEIPLKENQ